MSDPSDPTEGLRRLAVASINGAVESDDATAERTRLESVYGQVWNTRELSSEYDVVGFLAPFVEVKRKADGAHGTLKFQHRPRFYFNFVQS